jgi:hypothetical protein
MEKRRGRAMVRVRPIARKKNQQKIEYDQFHQILPDERHLIAYLNSTWA